MSRSASILSLAAALTMSSVSLQAQSAAASGAQPPARLPATTVIGASTKSVTVQNDRQTAVSMYLDVGRVDLLIGTIDAGAVATIALPDAAIRGQRQVKLVARTDADAKAIASYTIATNDPRQLGLLIPPANGLPNTDSLVVSLPKGEVAAATVTIANERNGSVSVFAEQGLLFVKLGEVGAKQQETLLLPAYITKSKTPVRVFARPDGASSISTKAMKLEQGDHIAVIVM